MFDSDQYELVDFGNRDGIGLKLERFGGYLISRPCPAANSKPLQHSEKWNDADAAFLFPRNSSPKNPSNERGKWQHHKQIPEPWVVRHGETFFQLKPTPFGHVGLFVEQQENWSWITRKIQSASKPVRVLNLFAYTGGSTMAAAAAGADVVHIDSAKNIVQWARDNARLSGLDDRPIRWIVEDCSRFVERELKRGNRYDAIILDPPSFGHGPKGEVWKVDRDLIRLLRQCKQLLSESPVFFLMTCHSPGFGPAELQASVCDAIFGTCSVQVASKPLSIQTPDGRSLNAGNVVRWPR